MENKNTFSRRGFLKTTALASTTIAGVTTMMACSNPNVTESKMDEPFPFFHGDGYQPSDGVAGLLFSQIGYEAGFPVRIVVRLPKKKLLTDKGVCKLIPLSASAKNSETPCTYWGEIWGSHWWVAEFNDMNDSGEWAIEIHDKGKCVMRDKGLRVAKNILWDSTVELAAADMLERRVHFTKVGAGWQDAGTLWVESCSQSAMVIGLEDLVESGKTRLPKELLDRVYKQITVGCDYLVMLEKKATELGFPIGAMSHDLHGHEKDVIPWTRERCHTARCHESSHSFNSCKLTPTR